MKERRICRGLDEQAKVFTLVSNPKYCSVFRFTVVLKENVDRECLIKAYKKSLEKYKALKVRLRCGLFEYYLEENDKDPLVFEESFEPTIKKINNKKNNDYLIKVVYSSREIYFDFYHALTDGTTGVKFVKEVVSKYLELKYSNETEIEYLNDTSVILESNDPYRINSKGYEKVNYKFSEGIRIVGKSTLNGNVEINHFSIDINQFKNKAKEYGCTISMYITALIGYTIYDLVYKNSDKKKPINLCIPISLNKYFETETLSNFFSHMIISLDLKEKEEYTIEEIIAIVKEQFEDKIALEKIMGVVESNTSKMNSLILKCVPLCIKKLAFVLGSLKLKKQFSMTVSNIGKIEFDEKFDKYIDTAYVTLSCDWAERVKCGMSSYKDRFIVTFCKNIVENDFENKFKKLLTDCGLEYKIFGNYLSTLEKE